jgi:hypothetical protein
MGVKLGNSNGRSLVDPLYPSERDDPQLERTRLKLTKLPISFHRGKEEERSKPIHL